ncbi:DUF1684 domain-containing protein [Wenzhouxiangella sp. AB-CW3]|uniref:DUF1684 domain-containing protein n=1 Tax=Wenzhouxiangella sp. AB-CW3 TaxID=2771012 RepID=UPI00168B0DD0|nr:DUF1684 domain-containing protein [Wenzhouxiangella sp. AB-CW3]QOC23602.1 DUF1684 domain-containing protein [Wenzhouxiangella sp. AB-CW3]
MKSMLQIVLSLLMAAVLMACSRDEAVELPTDDLLASAEQAETAAMAWREDRLERLTEPYGWLSLVGLEFPAAGEHVVGSDPDADLVMPAGPAEWGRLTIGQAQARFEPSSDEVALLVDGQSGDDWQLYPRDADSAYLTAEEVRIELVARGDRLAVRTRWPQSPARVDFQGLEYFDFDPAWVVEARFEYHPEGTTLPVGSVLGDVIDEPNLGAAVFRVDGREYRLEAVADRDSDELFFIFADRTTGHETYGAGRFLYAAMPDDERRTVLDFNRSYNPPCTFTEYSTCPLPPPANRLDLRVEAGELDYAGEIGFSDY